MYRTLAKSIARECSIGQTGLGGKLEYTILECTLRQQVLRRDGWRCQLCGTRSNLEVHHQQFRSHSGHDSEENLITLCTQCHAGIHG